MLLRMNQVMFGETTLSCLVHALEHLLAYWFDTIYKYNQPLPPILHHQRTPHLTSKIFRRAGEILSCEPSHQRIPNGMSDVHNSVRTIASPSSDPSTAPPTQSMQGYTQASTTLAVANLHPNSSLCDIDDDDLSAPPSDSDSELSEAPESPVFPTLSTSSQIGSTTPPSDPSSELSSAPSSPPWSGHPQVQPNRSLCTEKDCPVRKAVRRHYQGEYRHRNKAPRTTDSLFDTSNPPPHIWESWIKIQARDPGSTVEDDWNVLGFLRWHVDDPNTSFMGI